MLSTCPCCAVSPSVCPSSGRRSGLSWTFPAQALGPALSLKHSGSFQWRMEFRSHDAGSRCAQGCRAVAPATGRFARTRSHAQLFCLCVKTAPPGFQQVLQSPTQHHTAHSPLFRFEFHSPTARNRTAVRCDVFPHLVHHPAPMAVPSPLSPRIQPAPGARGNRLPRHTRLCPASPPACGCASWKRCPR